MNVYATQYLETIYSSLSTVPLSLDRGSRYICTYGEGGFTINSKGRPDPKPGFRPCGSQFWVTRPATWLSDCIVLNWISICFVATPNRGIASNIKGGQNNHNGGSWLLNHCPCHWSTVATRYDIIWNLLSISANEIGFILFSIPTLTSSQKASTLVTVTSFRHRLSV